MISGKRHYVKGVEFQILMKEYMKLLGSGNLNDFFPMMRWVDFQGIKKKMVKVMNKMDSFFQKLLDEHRRNRSTSAGNHNQRNMTLIDVILDLQEREPEFYTHETMKGVVLVRKFYVIIHNNDS